MAELGRHLALLLVTCAMGFVVARGARGALQAAGYELRHGHRASGAALLAVAAGLLWVLGYGLAATVQRW